MRHYAIEDDFSIGVQIAQIVVQGIYPLNEAPLQHRPIIGGNDPRDGVEGEKPLLELTVFIQPKLHPVTGQLLVDAGTITHQSRIKLRLPSAVRAFLRMRHRRSLPKKADSHSAAERQSPLARTSFLPW